MVVPLLLEVPVDTASLLGGEGRGERERPDGEEAADPDCQEEPPDEDGEGDRSLRRAPEGCC